VIEYLVFEESMNYSLLMIGAHSGKKQISLIKDSSSRGKVILVEPVPWIFDKLLENTSGVPNIDFINAAISDKDRDEVDFFAPKSNSNEIANYADQLGSFFEDHANIHNTNIGKYIERMKVKTISIAGLIERFEITDLDLLFTDTEGHDADILLSFPFNKIKPRRILFEFKHSDGTFHIGRKLGNLITILESHGYRNRVIDAENCLSTLS